MDIVPLVAITIVALYGIQGAYQPAVQASIPVLVSPEHLMQGNSIINLINSLASMLGPVFGGILFSVFGLSPILYVSCLLYTSPFIFQPGISKSGNIVHLIFSCPSSHF